MNKNIEIIREEAGREFVKAFYKVIITNNMAGSNNVTVDGETDSIIVAHDEANAQWIRNVLGDSGFTLHEEQSTKDEWCFYIEEVNVNKNEFTF